MSTRTESIQTQTLYDIRYNTIRRFALKKAASLI